MISESKDIPHAECNVKEDGAGSSVKNGDALSMHITTLKTELGVFDDLVVSDFLPGYSIVLEFMKVVSQCWIPKSSRLKKPC